MATAREGEGFQEVVSARDETTKQFPVPQGMASLQWDIGVAAYTIDLRVVGTLPDGTNLTLYDASKVEGSQGSTNVRGFQFITFAFDNRGSMLRKKRLNGRIRFGETSLSPWLISVPPRAFREAHRRAILGVRLFFANKFALAEDVFRSGADVQPILALGYSAMSVVRAVTGLHAGGVREAQDRIKSALTLCGAVISKSDKGSEELCHTTLIKAECELMLGLTHLLSERITGVIKCGLAVRRGFKLYQKASGLMGKIAQAKARKGVKYHAEKVYTLSMDKLVPEMAKPGSSVDVAGMKDIELDSDEEEHVNNAADDSSEDSEEEAEFEKTEATATPRGVSVESVGAEVKEEAGEKKEEAAVGPLPGSHSATSLAGVIAATLDDHGIMPGLRPCLPTAAKVPHATPAVFGSSDPILTSAEPPEILSKESHSWVEVLGPGGSTGSDDVLLEGGGKMRRGVEGGLFFGFGSFNTLISCLPPVVLKLVEFLGFPTERMYGEQLLEMALSAGGIRAPVAGMILCGVRAILPTFYSPFDTSGTEYEAEKTLRFCLQQYPDSALFNWVNGRWQRRQGNVTAAVNAFRSVAVSSSELVQLQHVAAYEMAMTAFNSRSFDAAGLLLRFLFSLCPWSRRFFAYLAGICFLQEGLLEKAKGAFVAVVTSPSRKIGGREISADQHAFDQAQALLEYFSRHQVLDDDHQAVMTPNIRRLGWLEMLMLFYLYNGADNAPTDVLVRHIKDIQEYLEGQQCPIPAEGPWRVISSPSAEGKEEKEEETAYIPWPQVSVDEMPLEYAVRLASERILKAQEAMRKATEEDPAATPPGKAMKAPPTAGFSAPREERPDIARVPSDMETVPNTKEYWKRAFSFPAAQNHKIHLDHLTLVALVAGSCLSRLGHREAGEECFNFVLGREKEILHKWKVPYAMYELAINAETPALRMSWARRAKKFKEDYNYSWRLQFRVHLLMTELRLLKKKK